MDHTKLPFDMEEMIAGLKPSVECESPTYDAAAVDRMIDLAAYDPPPRVPGSSAFRDDWASADQ
ncbi:MAG: hypothetical protein R3C97_07450 [Geminicoccaceae bacterium]